MGEGTERGRRHAPLAPSCARPHACPVDVRRRVLASTTLFSALGAEEHASVTDTFRARGYHEDSVVCHAGEQARELFVLATGRLKLSRPAAARGEVVVDIVLPGTMFGALPGGGHPTYEETARALTVSCVLSITVPRFQALLTTHPAVALAVVSGLSDHLAHARAALARLAGDTVERRLAATLLAIAERTGHERKDMTLLQVPLARADLAAMAGTTTESVSRTLTRWRHDGIVRTGRRWVGIEDLDALRAIADGDDVHLPRSPRRSTGSAVV